MRVNIAVEGDAEMTEVKDSGGKNIRAKKLPALVIIIILLVGYCASLAFDSFFFYHQEMKGTVTDRFGNTARCRVAYIRVDNGPKIAVPLIWNNVQSGDRIEKKQGSFIILINDVPGNGIFEALKRASTAGACALLLYISGTILFGGGFKNSKRNEEGGR